MASDPPVDVAIRRMDRIGWVLAAAGTAVTFAGRGVSSGCGFLCGALISLLNFRWWKTVVGRLGDPGRGPGLRGSAAILGLRYLLIGGAIYVIVKYLEVNLTAILAGLFVSVAAVVIELLYELIYGT